MFKDLKYLFAYIAPVSAICGFYLGGWWYYAAFLVGFVFIPLLETTMPVNGSNLSYEEELSQVKKPWFDLLIYLNLPILFFILYLFFTAIGKEGLNTYEYIGLILSMSVIMGSTGINVAHELGHRVNVIETTMAKFMLMPALYMHFNIEHNLGHHKHVATDEDPSSARLGESVYKFWIRSTVNSYINAWKIEHTRLKKAGLSIVSYHNEMILFQLAQLAYLITIYVLFGMKGLIAGVLVAIGGFLMLETVNYIEHYGLRRNILPNGRYEPASFIHSWNSNHELGRIFLYELTRHSDHHFKSTRKYQVLRHFDESPQLPYGYPSSILLSLIPPLWFRIMNNRVKAAQLSN
ncbi:MAG TPA: alkane 1-monooxygenase [Saprospiraceae bacterium]|nr:alkane 1-monooxygenase [Saprospiraceae bacterium]